MTDVFQTLHLPFAFRAAILAGLSALASCGGEDATDGRRAALEQQRLEVLNQFAAAQNEVRNTQSDALEHPEVQPLREEFYRLFREKIVELDPAAETLLDRARELGSEIDDLSRPIVVTPGSEPASDSARRATMREFQALEARLRPLQTEALADPEVGAAFSAMQDSVHATMIRLNPAAAGALERMERASARLDSIDAVIRSLPT